MSEKFKELLESNHQFPLKYIHKIIGLNSDIFKISVADFESKFIGLKRSQEKPSASGKHIAITYEYFAANADDVVFLVAESNKINDLVYVL